MTSCATGPLPLKGSESQLLGTWGLILFENELPQLFHFNDTWRWFRQTMGKDMENGYYSFNGQQLKLRRLFTTTATANVSGDILTINYSTSSRDWVYRKTDLNKTEQ